MNFSRGEVFRLLRLYAILPVLLLSGMSGSAQQSGDLVGQSADKIIAIVGRNRIILQSELEMQIAQARVQDPDFDEKTYKCFALQSMIQQKMQMEQADRDSVSVSEEDVEGQLDNRLRYFISLYGSKEKLEQVSGKTIYQLKEEYRDVIKDQMVAEKVANQVLEHVKITPAEVEAVFPGYGRGRANSHRPAGKPGNGGVCAYQDRRSAEANYSR
jgi:peptidyl-prolyl cis-trans isomerase SurA